MRYLILSDLHANLQALDAVLRDAAGVGYDEVLVLGDIVGYNADPAAVVARVFDLAPRGIVRGNHDKVCAGLEPMTTFSDAARAAIEWTRSVLTPADLARLRDLPQGPVLVDDDVEICHGSPFDEDRYLFDAADARPAFAAASRPICLFGHTHVPTLFAERQDAGRSPEPVDVDGHLEWRLPHAPVLINVGAVGQPRDGDPRAAYGVLDLARRSLHLRRVTYDITATQQRILEEGLPPWLALRLGRGE